MTNELIEQSVFRVEDLPADSESSMPDIMWDNEYILNLIWDYYRSMLDIEDEYKEFISEADYYEFISCSKWAVKQIILRIMEYPLTPACETIGDFIAELHDLVSIAGSNSSREHTANMFVAALNEAENLQTSLELFI